MSSLSDSSFLMSVRELIDAAFGDPETNTVNHKLIQTILLLLARQLRMLERRVEVEINPMALRKPRTSLSISEIKIHAIQKDKKAHSGKDSGGKIGDSQTGQGRHQDTGKDKSITDKSSILSSTDKTSSDLTSSADKRSSLPTSTSEKTSSGGKSSTDKTTTEKSSSDKSSTDKTNTDKTSTDMTSTDKTSTDKSSTIKSSTDKSSTDKSSTEKSSADKSSSDKTSSDKTSTDKTSTDKSSSDKTTTDKSSSDKTSTDKTSMEKSSTDKYSSQKSSTDQIASLKRSTLGTIREAKKLEKIQSLLEIVEERRERELRVIQQRADSLEEPVKTPTPMTSLDSVEAQYEKLLIVERVPSGEAKARAKGTTGGDYRGRTPPLSVVTQVQFEALEAAVFNLQKRFAPIGEAGFPENIQLMQELRKGASLTDAMAALQLAARLETAEKTLHQMMSIVTDLAKQSSGINLTTPTSGVRATTTVRGPDVKSISTIGKAKSVKHATETVEITPSTQSSESVEIYEPLPPPLQDDDDEEEEEATTGPPPIRVTYPELEIAMQEVHDEIMKNVMGITTRSAANADNVMRQVNKLEKKLDESISLAVQMSDLEKAVTDYAEQINVLDTSLSSQMTNYQDQLTQMQHDLETGLETMAEALANTGGDTVAVAELNGHFTNLQMDFDSMKLRQRDLQSNQQALSLDLSSLWRQIELLRETKSDREEVADALRDKAGIRDLNGLVSLQQFEAVRGDFEKRIGAAYDKFNNQEIVWQKAIDELMRELNEKAELVQVYSLKDDINKHLNDLKSRLHAMLEIVGEPRAAAISKKLHRDAACLSCASPAHMALEEPGKVPALPEFHAARQPSVGAKYKPTGDGDHSVCYPGLPIPHPIDPRAHVCNRYCGGSHTRMTSAPVRAPPGILVNPVRGSSIAPGTDGKMYKIDASERKPCSACNVMNAAIPEVIVKDPEPRKEEHYGSSMTPSDYVPMSQVFVCEDEDSNATPPPPIEHDSVC